MRRQKEKMDADFEQIKRDREELAYAQDEIKNRQKQYELKIKQ